MPETCRQFHFGPLIEERLPPPWRTMTCQACGNELTPKEREDYQRMHKTFTWMKIRLWQTIVGNPDAI